MLPKMRGSISPRTTKSRTKRKHNKDPGIELESHMERIHHAKMDDLHWDCSGTQGSPKRPNTKRSHSHKQITYQYTNVCHVVKILERETVHGPSQIATWSNLLCKRKKVSYDLLIIHQLAKDPPLSLNIYHGPIMC